MGAVRAHGYGARCFNPRLDRDRLTDIVLAPCRPPESSTASMDKPRPNLDTELLLFEQRLPRFCAGIVDWVRRPSSRFVRLPMGGLLVVGGLFGFLPILGFWMLPLGLILLARDVPALEPPLARMFAWINRTWPVWRADRSDQPPT
jgi:hypothetical protein